jgi:aminoglycoside phosphotransferase (APT) family kinase protein
VEPREAHAGDANALDAAALGPYLEQHVPGFAGLEPSEKFSAGQSGRPT